jgi:hypothetical protein
LDLWPWACRRRRSLKRIRNNRLDHLRHNRHSCKSLLTVSASERFIRSVCNTISVFCGCRLKQTRSASLLKNSRDLTCLIRWSARVYSFLQTPHW